MSITRHNPATLPSPVGNYSQAVEVQGQGRFLFISGQIPEQQDGHVPSDFESQCTLIWENIHALLRAAGMNFDNLIKVTTYLTHADQVQQNSVIRQLMLGPAHPALTVIIAQTLESKWLLEIEAIAATTG